MLISKRHNFIFIHVPKAAGQSVTNALMPHAATRWQCMLSPLIPFRYQLKIFTKIKTFTNISFHPQPFSDHVKTSMIADTLGFETFNNYFSFAFVRNPWAWILSRYTYAIKNPRHTRHKLFKKFDNFDDFIRWHCSEDEKFYLQKSYVCNESGTQLVDFIGKQESLSEDFSKVCKKIGITSTLPRLNVSNETTYRNFYNDETIKLIAERYREDIEFFNYEY
mgnify:CR=1 FL=1|tara:strand:- start:117 stop:779 length:663 start_codon:yes stop_codon:yes gene_type:complete